MIIYAVTTLACEGRKIKAAFEDRDQAIYFCALLEGDESIIEVVDTEAVKISGNQKPLAEWAVVINTDGEVVDLDCRYTFESTLRHRRDLDGSYNVFLTLDPDDSEEDAKAAALEYWSKIEK